MRTGTSILVVILVITGMMHISVANHYCGGTLAATRVSLSGQLASCGMESTEINLPESGSAISDHCCDDIVVTVATDNNYMPSHDMSLNHQHNYQVLYPTIIFSYSSVNHFNSHLTNVMPPGTGPSIPTGCPDICVFRI
jgi:hypothetical protein